jgi:glycosyltransferase involved in cell wall biosynthesis
LPRPDVIYNGYPLLGSPSARPPRKVPGTFVIAAVGRLSVEKGHRYLLSALPAVAARHPAVRCWIAGQGPLEGALRQQIGDLGLTGVAELVGYCEDVEDVLGQADLFVMPSLYEGFGNALLQAMVAGLPVVASDLPVVRDDIAGGGRGVVLVPPGDVEALAGAIGTLVADAGARAGLSARSIEIGRRFQASRMIAAFAALYENLAGLRAAA